MKTTTVSCHVFLVILCFFSFRERSSSYERRVQKVALCHFVDATHVSVLIPIDFEIAQMIIGTGNVHVRLSDTMFASGLYSVSVPRIGNLLQSVYLIDTKQLNIALMYPFDIPMLLLYLESAPFHMSLVYGGNTLDITINCA